MAVALRLDARQDITSEWNHQGQGMELRAPNDDPNVIAFSAPSERFHLHRRTTLEGLINDHHRTTQ